MSKCLSVYCYKVIILQSEKIKNNLIVLLNCGYKLLLDNPGNKYIKY